MRKKTITIVTVCFNSAKTIVDTLKSVASQDYPDVEHILIDGNSTDETLELIKTHGQHVVKLVSEPDDGIFDAMNKGAALATGEWVAFLNSDDVYADEHCLSEIAEQFEKTGADFVYGDLSRVDEHGKELARDKPGQFTHMSVWKHCIPHPTLFVRRDVMLKIDPVFDPSYRLAADIKFEIILLNILKAQGAYLPRLVTRMRIGGASSENFLVSVKAGIEASRAYKEVLGASRFCYLLNRALRIRKIIRRLFWDAQRVGKS